MKQILEATSKNKGCFIMAGATGQGKTTVLKNLANQLYVNGTKIINSIGNTVDNKEITQIQCLTSDIYNEDSSIYEAPVNNSLKGGAEIIFIDEIRDKSTAKVIEKSYISALLITTVHASSSIGIIHRLGDLNISLQTIANPDFCQGMLFQKLLPVVCPHCSKDVSTIIDDRNAYHYVQYLETFKKKYPGISLDNIRIRNHIGCSKCYGGIISRTACAEIVVIDNNMRHLITDNNLEGLHSYWRALSDNNLLSKDMTGKTAHEHALSKMLLGEIDPIDVLNKFQQIE